MKTAYSTLCFPKRHYGKYMMQTLMKFGIEGLFRQFVPSSIEFSLRSHARLFLFVARVSLNTIRSSDTKSPTYLSNLSHREGNLTDPKVDRP